MHGPLRGLSMEGIKNVQRDTNEYYSTNSFTITNEYTL